MPDDTIEIMGRIDTQIKLRGVRIESEGVSNVLRKASERPLDVATLIAKHPDSGSELLVSFVAFGDRQVSVSERRSGHVELAHNFPPALMESIKSTAVRELAVYMRPSYVIPVTFLPLSLNMKTDTKLLAEFFRLTPISVLLDVQREHNPTERPLSPQVTGSLDADQALVAEHVSRLSGTPLAKVRADSNLLECGMDSLKLSALARELRKAWPSTQVMVTDVLAAPVLASVASLKQTLSRQDSAQAGESVCLSFDRTWRPTAESIFKPEDIEAVLPTFPVQEGVLFQALVSPTQYVQHFIYRINGQIDNDRMYEAWTKVVSLCPILRAAFIVEDTPLQIVLRPEAVQIPFTVQQHSSFAEPQPFVNWFYASEKDRVSTEINSDLTSPLFRITVYESSERFMVVSLSHAVYDGFALPNLMRHLDATISGEEVDEVVPLQPILDAVQLSQASARQFWVQKLHGLHPKPLPRRPANSDTQNIRRTMSFSYTEAQAACRAHHTTLQALGCASYALAGRDCLGWRNDVVFGVIRSGRSLPVDDVENAVAPLVSLVPFVLSIHNKASSEVLQSSQTELASTLSYEHTQLGHIQRWVGAQPLFEALFSCRVEDKRAPYKSFEHCETKAPSTEFILSAEMLAKPGDNAIELRVVFTQELDVGVVERLLASFEDHFKSLAHGDSVSSTTASPNGGHSGLHPHDQSPNIDPEDANPELENTLIGAVASFLQTELSLVKVDTSLVSLGLTSLKAVTLSRRLKNSGIFVSPIDIIQADTIKRLSLKCNTSGHGPSESNENSEGQEWLDSLRRDLRGEVMVDNLKLSAEDEVHLICATALQAGMLSQTISSDDRLYVHGFTFKLKPECTIEKLKSTWAQTIQDVDILRTSFTFAEGLGRWVQVVHSKADLPWTSTSFRDPYSALADFISTLPFADVDDFKQPPLRLCHFNLDGSDYLLVVLHHALYDGISLPLLFNRFRACYHETSLPVQASFHDLVPQILISEHLGTSYWAKRLLGAEALILPREPNTPSGAWRSSVECQVEVVEIQRTCRRYQVNPQCLGQAAMTKILAGLSGRNDIVFGQVTSGRTLVGAEDVIGPVFNTIPCRVNLSSYRTYGDLLRGIQRSNNEGLSYQHASLRSIQRELGIKSLIDALFLFQPDAPTSTSGSPPIWDSVERANKEETKTQYGLNIELYQTSNGFTIRASCSAAVMDQTRLAEILAEFSSALRQISTRPTSLIDGQCTFAAPRPLHDHSERVAVPHDSGFQGSNTAAGTPEFDGWSEAQLKFKDILIGFTKVPASTVRPSSQLASLGLDSISSVQLTGIAKRSGIKLSASDIAKCTTVADVAAVIAQKSGSTEPKPPTVLFPPLLDDQIISQARSDLPASLRSSVESFLPTTPGMDFILSSWVRSGGWRFQHAFTFKVSPSADSSRLHRSWDDLVERHAILRSIFTHVADRNILCVLKPGSIRTPWIELVLEADKDDLEEVGRVARGAVVNPPLLRGGPSSRVTYIHGNEGDYLVLEMHHALYDAWSFNMILRDLDDLYWGKALTSRNDLAFLANSIAPRNNINEQRAYWEDALHGFQPSVVESTASRSSLLRPTNTGQLLKHARIPLLLSLGLLQAVAVTRHQLSRTARLITGTLAASGVCLSALEFARHSNADLRLPTARTSCVFRDVVFGFSAFHKLAMEQNLPLHMVLLACWARVQARKSGDGRQGVVFGLLHSGRGLDGTDEVAAPCINALPVYVREPLRGYAFTIAGAIQSDLRGRSALVEQSRLQDVSSWVGASGKPLFHYFVNMLKVPSSSGNDKASPGLLERIKVPRSQTATLIDPNRVVASSLATMGEVQDDCMIEIFFDSKRDSIGMEVSCKSSVLSESEANMLAEAWGREVVTAFRLRTVTI